MVMSTKQLIRKLPSKRLTGILTKMRKERERPGVYGKYGTSRYVTEREFWRGHTGALRTELVRRKKLGLIRKSAGKPRRKRLGYLF